MTSAPGQSHHETLRQRYGHTRDTRRALRRIAWIVAVIGLALVGWLIWGGLRPTAHSDLIAFDVVDESLTTATFEVVKPPDSTAQCQLQALNTGYGEVGVLTMQVGPADQELVRVEADIRTTELATTAVIENCTLVD